MSDEEPRPCQSCGSTRPIAFVSMTEITGMVFARREKYTAGLFCEPCVGRHYRRILAHNLAFGWWGVFSVLLTPIYTLENTFTYFRARGKLKQPRFDSIAIKPR